MRLFRLGIGIFAFVMLLAACGEAPAAPAQTAAPLISASPVTEATPAGLVPPATEQPATEQPAAPLISASPVAQATPAGVVPTAPERKPALRMGAPWNFPFSGHPAANRFNTTHFTRLHQTSIFGADPLEENVDYKYGVVESWQYDSGGTGLTLTIHKGLMFHDGSPITAEDVKFSFELGMSGVAEPQISSTLVAVGVTPTVADENTVHLKFDKASAIFAFEFSPMINSVYAVSKANHSNGAMTQEAFDAYAANPMGAGPYKFVKNEVQGFIILEAAGKDPLVGSPTFDRLEFNNIKETGTRMAMLRTGQLEIAEASREQVEPLRDAGKRIDFKNGARMIGLYIFQTYLEDSFTNNEDVRKAIAYSIDHKLLGETIFKGIGIQTWGCTWPPSTEISTQNPAFLEACATPYPYDPDRAKQHLAASGYAPGEVELKLTFWGNYPEEPDMAEAMQPMLEAVGIKATINRIDRATWTKLRNNDGLANTLIFFGPGGRLTSLSGSHSVWGPKRGLGPKHDADVMDALTRATVAGTLQGYTDATSDLGKLIFDRAYGPGFFAAASVWGVDPGVPKWGLEKSRGRGPLNLMGLVADLKP